MGVWDELFNFGTRGATKTAKKQPEKKAPRFNTDPALLRRLVPKSSAFGEVMEEAGSFFKPAGVLGRNAADFLLHPVDNLPFVGKGNSEGLTQLLKQVKQYQAPDTENISYRKSNPFDAASQMEAEERLRVPSLDPLAKALGSIHPIDAYNRLRHGVNPGDGELDAVLGSKGAERWQEATAGLDDIAAMDKRDTIMESLTKNTPAGQFFDRNTPDVFSAAKDAGYSDADATGWSLLNPLEWLGAESGVSRAAKLSKAAKGGRVNKVRQALNTAGSAMDPIQLGFDALGGVAGKVMKKAIDWRVPKKAAPADEIAEIARRAGVDPEELRHTREGLDPQQAAPVEQATKAVTRDEIDDILDGLGPVGDSVQDRVRGLLDETGTDYYERIARGIPDDYAPAALADDAASPPASVVDDALPEPEPILPPRPADIPIEHDASIGAPERYSPEADDLVSRLADEAFPSEGLAKSPREMEDAFLMREAQRVADEAEAGLEFRRLEAARSRAKDVQLEGKLAQLTPNTLPNYDEAALRSDVLFSAPPIKASGGNLIEQASQAPPIFRDMGPGAREAAELPGLRPVEPGAAPLIDAGSPAMELVDDVSAYGSPVAEGVAKKGTGLIRLSSTPVDLLWDQFKSDGFVATSAKALEAKVEGAVGKLVTDSPLLSDASAEFKRVFSEDYGKASAELGRAVTDYSMARDAIMRQSQEEIFHRLAGGDDNFRKAMQQYMNGSMSAQDAQRIGLSAEDITSANVVRDMMDIAGAEKIASSLELDRRFLTQASTEEKQLYRQLYETFSGRMTNIDKAGLPPVKIDSRGQLVPDPNVVPKKALNYNRKQVLEAAKATHSEQFIQKAQGLIDGAMQRMEAKGFVKDGRVIDMGLDWGTWISNLGKYEPRLYKMIEYGVDISSPSAAMDFMAAVESRQDVAWVALNEMRKALGEAPVPKPPLPEDLKRFILAHYTGQGAGWSAGVADEAARFMKRKDLSQEMRDILGPMANPAYTYTKGVQQVRLAEETTKFRRYLASNESLISRNGEKVEDYMKRTGVKLEEIAFDFADNPQYASQVGPLAGRFIHRDVADLLAMTGSIPHLHGPGSLEALKSASRTWLAVSKVILNPASHVRQGFQNTLHVYNSLGAGAVIDMFGAPREIASKSKDYLEARQNGLFSAGHDPAFYERIDLDKFPEYNFDGAELMLSKLARGSHAFSALAATGSKSYGAAKKALQSASNKAGELFSFSDDVARLATFKHYRKQGLSARDAALKARKNIYSGADRSRYSRFMSGLNVSDTFFDRGARSGGKVKAAEVVGGLVQNPFFGVTKFLWENFGRNMAGVEAGHWMPMTDPARAARTYGLLFGAYGMAELGKHMNGVSSEEESLQLPDYMRSSLPSRVMLPPQFSQLIGADGESVWLDHSAVTPWGQVSQGRWDPKRNKMSNMADNLLSSFAPGYGAFSKITGDGGGLPMNPALKPIVELFNNQDSFSGRTIYPTTQGAARAARGAFAHAWRSYLPPWAPNPVGLMQALEAVPKRLNDPEDWHEFVRQGVGGLANDSGHQASKLVSGAWNSLSDVRQGEVSKAIREAAHVQDYRGRDQSLIRALVDFLPLPTLGGRLEVRAINEVQKQRGNAKREAMSTMESEHTKRTQHMRGKDKQRADEQHRKAMKEIQEGKPSLRWYESPADAAQNAFGAILRTLEGETSSKDIT